MHLTTKNPMLLPRYHHARNLSHAALHMKHLHCNAGARTCVDGYRRLLAHYVGMTASILRACFCLLLLLV